eukprot:scaffold21351_cov96-Isochrysis_galbana.AAC.1
MRREFRRCPAQTRPGEAISSAAAHSASPAPPSAAMLWPPRTECSAVPPAPLVGASACSTRRPAARLRLPTSLDGKSTVAPAGEGAAPARLVRAGWGGADCAVGTSGAGAGAELPADAVATSASDAVPCFPTVAFRSDGGAAAGNAVPADRRLPLDSKIGASQIPACQAGRVQPKRPHCLAVDGPFPSGAAMPRPSAWGAGTVEFFFMLIRPHPSETDMPGREVFNLVWLEVHLCFVPPR